MGWGDAQFPPHWEQVWSWVCVGAFVGVGVQQDGGKMCEYTQLGASPYTAWMRPPLAEPPDL